LSLKSLSACYQFATDRRVGAMAYTLVRTDITPAVVAKALRLAASAKDSKCIFEMHLRLLR
jgi:hypothetical protein